MTFGKIIGNFALPTILAVFLLVAIPWSPVVAAAQSQDSKAAVAAGDSAAPDFELQDMKGENVSLSKFKGQKSVLLYFWATWCPHCMSVRPAVIALQKEAAENNLEILAINVGGGDSLAKVKLFQEVHPAPFTVLYDTDTKVTRSFRVQGIPLFILIDKNGAVRYRGNELPSNLMQVVKQWKQ